ncbi:MAG: diacylglycerol kinase family lipid kinase [bacterium]|nr:diacylglycerol kinase family lipid kinase [bacterium]
MRKCVIIMNPESGKVKNIGGKRNFYDILRKYDYDAEIKYTTKAKDATNIVKELPNDIDLVISAGGDGTLNEVVTGNLARTKKLTIANLPMGTTNDVASMYGLNSNYLNNLELLLTGKVKNVDICYVNETPFVYVACLGDYIDMAYNTPRELKKKYGKIAYIIYGLKQLRNKINSYNIKYKIDNKEYTSKASFIFITNSSRVAGVNDIYYNIKLDDKKFEVAIADVENKKEMLKLFVKIFNMDIKDVPGITYYQTDNFELEFLDPPKTSWCIDGEELQDNSVKFNFKVDNSIKMLLPKTNIKRLFTEDE